MNRLASLFLITIICINLTATNNFRVTARLRNDFSAVKLLSEWKSSNTLENRFIITSSKSSWKHYSDIRAYNFSGLAESFVRVNPKISVVRSYVKLILEKGDLSIGKIYASMGNIGIFNPFDIGKDIQFSDLNYDQEGIIGGAYDYFIDDLSGGTVFFAPESKLSDSKAGLRYFTNMGSFDFGGILLRFSNNSNITGIHFKGDMGIGVHGALGHHFDDKFENGFLESHFGIDYSWGNLFAGLSYYYNESGFKNPGDYLLKKPNNTYFLAQNYLFANAVYTQDEFVNYSSNLFYNFEDDSFLFNPGIRLSFGTGLSVEGQLFFASGEENQEFSSSKMGRTGVIIRVENYF